MCTRLFRLSLFTFLRWNLRNVYESSENPTLGGMDEDFFSIRIQLKGLDHELQILPNTVINMLKYKIISENVKRERERERVMLTFKPKFP